MFDQPVEGGTTSETEVEATVLELGRKALISALGPAGAMKFLQYSDVLLQDTKKPHEIKPVVLQITPDTQKNKVKLEFSRQISWILFDRTEILKVTEHLIAASEQLNNQ